MEEDDFLMRPLVFRILSVVKAHKEGINKEGIYENIPGSKQTKVSHVKELEKRGLITVKTMKDLEREGAIDARTVRRGEWNSRLVTISEEGEDLLEKLENIRALNASGEDETISTSQTRSEYASRSYNQSRNFDRYAYGYRIATYRLNELKHQLDDPEVFNSESDLERAIALLHETIKDFRKYLGSEHNEMINHYSGLLSKYEEMVGYTEALSILAKDLIGKIDNELKDIEIDGGDLLNAKLDEISKRLEMELPGTYENVKNKFEELRTYLKVLFV